MKKLAALVSAFSILALLRTEPAYAADFVLFNNVTANAVSVPDIVETGEPICELKITGTGGAAGIVTLYHATEKNASGLVDPAVWYTVTNPGANDRNNHLVGACPKYVSAALTSYTAGTFRVTLRTKR